MRVACYYRFSSEMQAEGFSIASQRRACEAYASQRNWEIVATFTDEARSARTDNVRSRPGFQSLMQAAVERRFDAVIVHKLDRFARNRRVAFEAFEQLAKHGVGFVSVAEDMDYSSPAGQLMLTMLVGLSQFYSDNLSFETKKGKQERKLQGKYNGKLPIGYDRGPDGNAVINDAQARVVRRIYELSANGETDRDIAMAMNAAGYRTKGVQQPGLFTKDAVRVILRNRFYLGELPVGSVGYVSGNHPPLLDQALFNRVQAMRAQNATTGRGRRTQPTQAKPREHWTLSGIAYCARCGKRLTRGGSKSSTTLIRCSGRNQGNGCTMPAFAESRIVALIQQHLEPLLTDDLVRDRWLLAWRLSQQANIPAVRDRHVIVRKLERAKELYMEGDIDRDEYQRRRGSLQEELASLPDDCNPDDVLGNATIDELIALAHEWTTASSERRYRIALQLFDRVEIDEDKKQLSARVTVRSVYSSILAAASREKPPCGGSDGIHVSDRAAPIHPGHRKKLTPEQELTVLSRPEYSLRDLAALLNVSHETIRRIRKEAEAAD